MPSISTRSPAADVSAMAAKTICLARESLVAADSLARSVVTDPPTPKSANASEAGTERSNATAPYWAGPRVAIASETVKNPAAMETTRAGSFAEASAAHLDELAEASRQPLQPGVYPDLRAPYLLRPRTLHPKA